MEAYKKGIVDLSELVVFLSTGESYDYFLRGCPAVGFTRLLDFRWTKKGKIKASVTFALSEAGEAISLPQTPFGGFFVDPTLSSASLDGFIKAVLEDLRRRHICHLRLVQAPKPYEPKSDLINYLLFKNGFSQQSVLSHHFFLGKNKIKKLVKKELGKFQVKAKEAGLMIQVGPIQNFGFLQEIRSWNGEKGYETAVDEKRLITQVSDFPERYFLISLLKDGQAVAYTLAVKLLPDSLYYFLAAIRPEVSAKNLGELCLFYLFQLASDQGASFVDLGSSDVCEEAKHSLMFFKSRYSNDISNKITWELDL